MDEIILVSLAIKVAFGVIGVVGLLGMLRLFDKLAGVVWSEHVWEKMREDPQAIARYFGMRFLGVCLLLGLIVSR